MGETWTLDRWECLSSALSRISSNLWLGNCLPVLWTGFFFFLRSAKSRQLHFLFPKCVVYRSSPVHSFVTKQVVTLLPHQPLLFFFRIFVFVAFAEFFLAAIDLSFWLLFISLSVLPAACRANCCPLIFGSGLLRRSTCAFGPSWRAPVREPKVSPNLQFRWSDGTESGWRTCWLLGTLFFPARFPD